LPVKASPISRTAAVLIIALGVFMLAGGLLADDLADEIAGVAFTVLGVVLYRLLYVLTSRVAADLDEAEATDEGPKNRTLPSGSSPTPWQI
jgi:drug/metabolite transporter (DMT)-like permease